MYATSIDYNPKALESIKFFEIVQNKLRYAIGKNTTSEIIYNKVDASKEFMGLTVFNGNIPIREETHIAKNYLDKSELEKLNCLVSAFFDLAELKAIEHIPMYMDDWIKELDDFTNKYGDGVLIGSGKITDESAMNKANVEYDKYKNRLSNEMTDIEKEYFKLLDRDIKNIKN